MGDAKRREDAQEEIQKKIEAYRAENPSINLWITVVAGKSVIGEIIKDVDGVITIYRPRIVQVESTITSQTKVWVVQLLGNPDAIENINSSAIAFKYEVKDQKLINLYIQNILGLVIPEPNILSVRPGVS